MLTVKSHLVAFMVGVMLCIAFAGCTHEPVNPHYEGPEPLPEKIKTLYSYKKFQGPYKESRLGAGDNYILKRIEFPSGHNVISLNHDITIDYYDVNGDEKRPVVIVLPVLGGGNSISKKFASYFADNGYAAAIVHRQEEFKEVRKIELLEGILNQIVLDHKQAIDWIELQEDVDKENIGVFGVSMGSIKGALVSALDSRIRASILALAAGDLPYVLTHSKEKGIEKRRNAYLKREDITLDDFYEKTKATITCDPINYAGFMDARKVLMVLGRFDRVMPYGKGTALWEKMGRPELITLPCGHYTALPFIGYIKKESLRFYREKFDT